MTAHCEQVVCKMHLNEYFLNDDLTSFFSGEMSDDPLCQEQAPDDATHQCCVAVFCSSSQDEDYEEEEEEEDGQPQSQHLPESILKQVDLSAKPDDGSDEFLQVSC